MTTLKKAIIVLPIIIVIGAPLALRHNSTPRPLLNIPNKTPTPTVAVDNATPTQSTVPESTTTTSQDSTTTPSTTPPTTPVPAAYGEDPANPGVFIVNDTSSVMTNAGIGVEQQAAASQIIAKTSNWIYKKANLDFNLCGVSPSAKMASAGADYIDNPSTQLKWCNGYVAATYGDWNQALVNFNKTHNF